MYITYINLCYNVVAETATFLLPTSLGLITPPLYPCPTWNTTRSSTPPFVCFSTSPSPSTRRVTRLHESTRTVRRCPSFLERKHTISRRRSDGRRLHDETLSKRASRWGTVQQLSQGHEFTTGKKKTSYSSCPVQFYPKVLFLCFLSCTY